MSWSVYLLYNPRTNRTYIGSTTDVHRRLRQHNREITGGARSTHTGSPNWTLQCYLSGFESRSAACRWEKILKMRCRGIDQRAWGFRELVSGMQPGKKGKYYKIPDSIELVEENNGST